MPLTRLGFPLPSLLPLPAVAGSGLRGNYDLRVPLVVSGAGPLPECVLAAVVAPVPSPWRLVMAGTDAAWRRACLTGRP